MAHALARAFAPERDGDTLAVRLERGDVLRHRFEHVAAGLGALGGEIAPLLGIGINGRPLPFRHGERGQPRQRDSLEPRAPLGFTQIQALRRQRLVGRGRSALRIVSSVWPKKSSLTGSAMPGAKRSMMPPRTA